MANKNLDELAMHCIVFVDRNGTVLEKDGSPMHSTLSMEYKRDPWDISFRVQSQAQGNGSSKVLVRYRGNLVLDAAGKFTTAAYDVKASTYIPGAWEKKIPEYK